VTDKPTEDRIRCTGIDYYSCEEALNRLNDYLDHELNDAERMVVAKHLEICKPCFSRFSFEQTLVVSLRQKIVALAAPEGIRSKLKDLLRNKTQSR
jgi:anti-sigma factor (TIGR02949 family)